MAFEQLMADAQLKKDKKKDKKDHAHATPTADSTQSKTDV